MFVPTLRSSFARMRERTLTEIVVKCPKILEGALRSYRFFSA
jgi:hypothetical protein